MTIDDCPCSIAIHRGDELVWNTVFNGDEHRKRGIGGKREQVFPVRGFQDKKPFWMVFLKVSEQCPGWVLVNRGFFVVLTVPKEGVVEVLESAVHVRHIKLIGFSFHRDKNNSK